MEVIMNLGALRTSLALLSKDVDDYAVQIELERKPKNFVLDDWIDFQPLINGNTLVWYWCDIRGGIYTKII